MGFLVPTGFKYSQMFIHVIRSPFFFSGVRIENPSLFLLFVSCVENQISCSQIRPDVGHGSINKPLPFPFCREEIGPLSKRARKLNYR